MTPQMARRFAEVSLELHAHEGSFELGLANIDDLAAVARAFANLGYAPDIDAARMSIRIDVASLLLRSATLVG